MFVNENVFVFAMFCDLKKKNSITWLDLFRRVFFNGAIAKGEKSPFSER